jgi:hypothetical protein
MKPMTLSSPRFVAEVRVANCFSFLCCPIICLYVLSSMVWCPIICLYVLSKLRFPHTNDVWFVFTSSCLYGGSCLIYVICVCLRIVSNAYCVVCLLCFSSSCCQFLLIVHIWFPFLYYLTFIYYIDSLLLNIRLTMSFIPLSPLVFNVSLHQSSDFIIRISLVLLINFSEIGDFITLIPW